MAYSVTRIQNQREPRGTLLDVVNFPPIVVQHAITTKISLWEVEQSIGGVFTANYWKNLFNKKKMFNILVQQTDPVANKFEKNLLYSDDNEERSKEAFNNICQTLSPLVDDCTLLLSEELLQAVILPVPTVRSKLIFSITELMSSNPSEDNTYWLKVLQSLTLGALRNDDTASEEGLKEVLTNHELSTVVSATDRSGNTAFHLAKSEKSIGLLANASEHLGEDERKKLVNQQNREGLTPLHTAFQEDKKNVVKHLVSAGADLDAKAADDEGSNPLHLAAKSGSSESVRILHHREENFFNKDSDEGIMKNALDATNKEGETPLMISVRKNSLDIAEIFLEIGANPDFQNPINGNTALHYAAQLGYTPILKALLAFLALPDIKNKAGKTPFDVASSSKAIGAEECKKILKQMVKLTREAEAKVSHKLKPVDIPPNPIFMLSLDGGGSRGLLEVQTLLAIHKRMKQLKPDSKPLHEYFDYITGTSAGGILANVLGILHYTPEKIRSVFFKVIKEVFVLPPTIQSQTVEEAFQGALGKDTLITDSVQPRVIAMSVLANRNPTLLQPVRNYGGEINGQKPPHEWKIWESCRATSAAPFYFPPYEDKFMDGALMANNPTLETMTEILQVEEEEKSGRKLALVVSLGTGILPPSPRTDDIAIYVPNLQNLCLSLANVGNSLSAATNLLHSMLAQVVQTDGEVTVQARVWCRSLGIPYYRLSPPLSQIMDLIEADVAILTNSMFETQKYLLKNADQVDAIASTLLSRDLH